jgi:hypothetical protein
VFTGTCEAFAMRTPPVICSSMYLTYGLPPVRGLRSLHGILSRLLVPLNAQQTAQPFRFNDIANGWRSCCKETVWYWRDVHKDLRTAARQRSTIHGRTLDGRPVPLIGSRCRGRTRREDHCPVPPCRTCPTGVLGPYRAIRCALVWYRRGRTPRDSRRAK